MSFTNHASLCTVLQRRLQCLPNKSSASYALNNMPNSLRRAATTTSEPARSHHATSTLLSQMNASKIQRSTFSWLPSHEVLPHLAQLNWSHHKLAAHDNNPYFRLLLHNAAIHATGSTLQTNLSPAPHC